MGKIVVIGSSNTDLVIRTPRIPSPGETLIGSDFMINAGGKGANQAVAAARMGGDVCFVACVGDDGFGAEPVRHLPAKVSIRPISYAAMALLRAWRLSP